MKTFIILLVSITISNSETISCLSNMDQISSYMEKASNERKFGDNSLSNYYLLQALNHIVDAKTECKSENVLVNLDKAKKVIIEWLEFNKEGK